RNVIGVQTCALPILFKSSSKTPKKNGPTCKKSRNPKTRRRQRARHRKKTSRLKMSKMNQLSSSRKNSKTNLRRQNPRQKPPSSRITPMLSSKGHQHQKTPCNLVKETPPTRLLSRRGTARSSSAITTPAGLIASDSAT